MIRRWNSRSLLNAIQLSELVTVMAAALTWILCEQTGRWAAALRLGAAQPATARLALRLIEVRSLAELKSQSDERSIDLTLIEVGQSNLAGVMEFLVNCQSHMGRFVALLDERREQASQMADVLWEAGAVDVFQSPRHLHRLFAISERFSASPPPLDKALLGDAFADWAWSTLPWQDA